MLIFSHFWLLHWIPVTCHILFVSPAHIYTQYFRYKLLSRVSVNWENCCLVVKETLARTRSTREDNKSFTFFLNFIGWNKHNKCLFHPMKQMWVRKVPTSWLPFFPWSFKVHQNVPFRAPKLQFYPSKAHRLTQWKGAYLWCLLTCKCLCCCLLKFFLLV